MTNQRPTTNGQISKKTSESTQKKTTLSPSKEKKSKGNTLTTILLFWVVLLGSALFASQYMELTIHSCNIYTPTYFDAVVGTSRALYNYAQKEGWSSLGEITLQFLKSEVFNRPPFYSIDEVEGKKLLMIGGGYIPEFLKHAKLLGVEVKGYDRLIHQIHLVDDPKMEQRTRGLVSKFIPVPNFGKESIQNPQSIIQLVKNAGITYDGVFTLVEDEGPLVSRLQRILGLPGNSEEASDIARNKFRMRQVMEKAGLPTPKYALIENAADLPIAAAKVGFPSFLKPVYGVAASFAAKVNSLEHLQETYKNFQSTMDPSAHSIYYYGVQMILEEMLDGSEIQLELMIHNGSMVFHCFSSEYAPKREWLVFPPNLTDTSKSQMLSLAEKTVKAIGISQGVVHIEMFESSKGPQIIEVNNRLSRGFLPRRFSHQLLFGERHTDYFGAVIFLALGLPPPMHERVIPPLSIAIFLDNPSTSGWETEGACAIFLGPSPAECLAEGTAWKQANAE